MRIAKRIEALPPYLFAELDGKLAAKREQGVDVISLYAASCSRSRSCSPANATARSKVSRSATAAVGFVGKFSQIAFVRSETGAASRSGRKPRSAGIGNDTGVPPASRVETP